MREKFNSFIKNLQKQITNRLCELEKKNDFKTEKWFRKEGGGGITCVIENGLVFEKGKIAFDGPIKKALTFYEGKI